MIQRKQPLLLIFIGGLLFLTGCVKKQTTESKSLKKEPDYLQTYTKDT